MADPFDYSSLYEAEEKTPYPRYGSPRLGGIGLKEAVVILAVLAIVVAILYPVFVGAKVEGRYQHTLSTVKQLALAHLMYASDHDERLAPAEAWMDATFPYIKAEYILHDPEIKDRKNDEYGFAFFKPISGVDTKTVLDHDKVPLVFQSMLMRRNARSDLSTLPTTPRNGKVNYVAFLDGHGKGMPPTWPEHPVDVVIVPLADPPSQR